MYKKQANKNTGEPKVIELNLSATVAVIIAIIVVVFWQAAGPPDTTAWQWAIRSSSASLTESPNPCG